MDNDQMNSRNLNYIKSLSAQSKTELGGPSFHTYFSWGNMENHNKPMDGRFLRIKNNISHVSNYQSVGVCWAAFADMLSDAFVISEIIDYNPGISATYLASKYDNSTTCSEGFGLMLMNRILTLTEGFASNNCIDYSWCSGDKYCSNSNMMYNSPMLRERVLAPGCYNPDVSHYSYTIKDVSCIDFNSKIRREEIVDAIKSQILLRSPVLFGFPMFENFRERNFWTNENKKGIYFEGRDAGSNRNPLKGYHMMCIMGWGEERILDENNQPQNVNYWHCRNTWGEGWGESGYCKIAAYPFNKFCSPEGLTNFDKSKIPGSGLLGKIFSNSTISQHVIMIELGAFPDVTQYSSAVFNKKDFLLMRPLEFYETSEEILTNSPNFNDNRREQQKNPECFEIPPEEMDDYTLGVCLPAVHFFPEAFDKKDFDWSLEFYDNEGFSKYPIVWTNNSRAMNFSPRRPSIDSQRTESQSSLRNSLVNLQKETSSPQPAQSISPPTSPTPSTNGNNIPQVNPPISSPSPPSPPSSPSSPYFPGMYVPPPYMPYPYYNQPVFVTPPGIIPQFAPYYAPMQNQGMMPAINPPPAQSNVTPPKTPESPQEQPAPEEKTNIKRLGRRQLKSKLQSNISENKEMRRSRSLDNLIKRKSPNENIYLPGSRNPQPIISPKSPRRLSISERFSPLRKSRSLENLPPSRIIETDILPTTVDNKPSNNSESLPPIPAPRSVFLPRKKPVPAPRQHIPLVSPQPIYDIPRDLRYTEGIDINNKTMRYNTPNKELIRITPEKYRDSEIGRPHRSPIRAPVRYEYDVPIPIDGAQRVNKKEILDLERENRIRNIQRRPLPEIPQQENIRNTIEEYPENIYNEPVFSPKNQRLRRVLPPSPPSPTRGVNNNTMYLSDGYLAPKEQEFPPLLKRSPPPLIDDDTPSENRYLRFGNDYEEIQEIQNNRKRVPIIVNREIAGENVMVPVLPSPTPPVRPPRRKKIPPPERISPRRNIELLDVGGEESILARRQRLKERQRQLNINLNIPEDLPSITPLTSTPENYPTPVELRKELKRSPLYGISTPPTRPPRGRKIKNLEYVPIVDM